MLSFLMIQVQQEIEQGKLAVPYTSNGICYLIYPGLATTLNATLGSST